MNRQFACEPFAETDSYGVNQCTPIPHFTSAVSNHHLQNAKISSHTQKWEPHMNICDETAMQTEIGDPKNKNACPCFDYSCVTMLPWTHHCLAFEILAIQLKHSPRWTNRQSDLNYPSRWTNPSDHCLRIIIDSIQKYLRSVNPELSFRRYT